MTHNHEWQRDGGGRFIYCVCGKELGWNDVIKELNAKDKQLAEGREIVERERDYWQSEYEDRDSDPDNGRYYHRDCLAHVRKLDAWLKEVANNKP